jgi:hypothetical protein
MLGSKLFKILILLFLIYYASRVEGVNDRDKQISKQVSKGQGNESPSNVPTSSKKGLDNDSSKGATSSSQGKSSSSNVPKNTKRVSFSDRVEKGSSSNSGQGNYNSARKVTKILNRGSVSNRFEQISKQVSKGAASSSQGKMPPSNVPKILQRGEVLQNQQRSVSRLSNLNPFASSFKPQQHQQQEHQQEHQQWHQQQEHQQWQYSSPLQQNHFAEQQNYSNPSQDFGNFLIKNNYKNK